MIKRVVEVSNAPAYISATLDQLELRFPEREGPPVSIPCEDLGALVVDQRQVTYSHHGLATLMKHGTVVVLCGGNHLPVGMVLPLSDHLEVVSRIHDQIALSKPVRKSLWRQLVVAKIRAQAGNLGGDTPARRRLMEMSRTVRSGDPSNMEAQAAKLYWANWLGEGRAFRRDPDGDGINALLNYGYALMRASVARALVGAGLNTALGIHHCNRSNAFCLADDLVEPLRPMVDAAVRKLDEAGIGTIQPKAKSELLGLLHGTVVFEGDTCPMMNGVQKMAYSLVRCIQGSDSNLWIPESSMD
ncbi:MAG: CRISPR-associated endonuclease Cas1 [Candidatus Hydrogenedentota bacterium]